MNRYLFKRKKLLRKRALAGVAGRERARVLRAGEMLDVGGFVSDGCLGVHSVRLMVWPGDVNCLALMVDGKHRRARTYRGVLRCLVKMVVGGMERTKRT